MPAQPPVGVAAVALSDAAEVAAFAGDVTPGADAALPASFLPVEEAMPLPGAAVLHEGASHPLLDDADAPSIATTRVGVSAVGPTRDSLLESPASSPTGEALLQQPAPFPPAAARVPDAPSAVAVPEDTANVPDGGQPGARQPTPPASAREATAGTSTSTTTAAEQPSPLRFATPAVTPSVSGATFASALPQTNTATSAGTAALAGRTAAGTSSRTGGGARHRSSTTSNRPGRGNARRDNFGGAGGVSYENFFFHSEDAATFGIGTVGLFAARAKPVTNPAGSGPRAPSKGAAHTTRDGRHRYGRRRRGETAANAGQRRTSLSDSHSLTPSAGGGCADGAAGGGSGGVPQYYTPACYTSPAVDGVTAWEKRRTNYRRWRRENLEGSSYYRLSRIGDGVATMCDGGGADQSSGATGADLDDGSPSMTNLLTPLLYSTEEQQLMEHRRLRALQAERAARTHSRASEQAAYEGEVLLQRVRKLRGEAVDLPDSYLRMTYPDESKLTGYAEAVLSGADKNRTFPGPYRSKAAAGYLANPQRAVKDHHRAVQQHRVNMQQTRLDREAQRAEAAEKQRRDFAAQVADSHARSTAYMATWMEGRPRVSRAREAERHALQEADQRAIDAWNRAEKMHEREAYSAGLAQAAAAAAARQQDLRTRVVAARPGSRKGSPGPRLGGASGTTSRLASPHDRVGSPLQLAATTTTFVPSTAAGVAAASGAGPSQRLGMAATAAPLPMLPRAAAAGAGSARPITPARTATPGRPITPALPPSQVVGPTSTNFFNEVKLWTQEFPSPNTIPANGADAAHRRAWKAELSDAQLRFNREATQRQREDVPRRMQEARDKAFEGHWHQAEQERHEKRDLASRRADLTQAEVDAATQLRVGVQEELQWAQQQRLVQAAERFTEAQFLRQQSKQRELVLRSIEAEDLHQLRSAVSSAFAANRG